MKPDFIRVTLPGSYEVKNNSLIGPYLEGASLSLSCESGPGRPIPDVSWWNGAQFLDNSSSTYTSAYNAQGIGTGRNELSYVLTRADIGSRFECRATSEALPLAWTSAVEVEVYGNLLLSHGHVVSYFVRLIFSPRPSQTEHCNHFTFWWTPNSYIITSNDWQVEITIYFSDPTIIQKKQTPIPYGIVLCRFV